MFSLELIFNKIENSPTFSIKDYDINGSIRSLNGSQLIEQCDKFIASFKKANLQKNSLILIPMRSNIESVVMLLAALKYEIFPIPIKSSMPKRFVQNLAFQLSSSIIVDTASRKLFENNIHIKTLFPEYYIIMPNKVSTIQGTYPFVGNIGILTSGTTEEPKIVVHTLNSIISNAKLHAMSVNLNMFDIIAVPLSMSFSYAIVAGLLSTMIQEATAILIDPSSKKLQNYIEHSAANTVMGTPYILQNILSINLLSKVNKMIIGGDIMQTIHAKKLFSMNPHIELYATYGLTEAGPRVATSHITNDFLLKYRSISLGIPLDGVTISLNNKEYGVNNYELIIETPTVMKGYFNKNNDTCRILEKNSNKLYSGDLFYIYNEQYFFSGRKKRIICRAGENIHPLEIEKAIMSFPYINSVLVTGGHDNIYGEVPIAFIVSSKKINIKSLEKYLLKKLPKSYIPVEWKYVSNLPVK